MMLLFVFLTAVSGLSGLIHTAPQYENWNVLQTPSEDTVVSFTLSVRESNLDKLRQVVADVSDPRSSLYGQYLTSAEIEELTRPAQADIEAVTSWLNIAGIQFNLVNHRDVQVKSTVGEASSLLATNFHLLGSTFPGVHHKLVRAGDFSLPPQVNDAVGAVFGLHGLPLPPRKPLLGENPADVTPAVLASTYKISGVTPSGSITNRQAVAEFQGQYMKPEDLTQFFKQYVPNAQAGDDTVYKFVGSTDRDSAGIEASLDIQYIMGVAPHVKTEFWLFAGQDFCLDLKNWTDTILSDDGAPLVHSVSYGWQGNLSQVGCTNDKVTYVDANFQKLAAKGITIIFASGDSGSGYAPSQQQCDASSYHQNTALNGTIHQTIPHFPNYAMCCQEASRFNMPGFMFEEAGPAPGFTCEPGQTGNKDTAYTGTPDQTLNVPSSQDPRLCCEVAGNTGSFFSVSPSNHSGEDICSLWHGTRSEPPTTHSPGSYSGKAATKAGGVCTLFSTVTGSSAKAGATSGKPVMPGPDKVQLWPSWPASSPYVTAVGATRFVGQQVGNAEMATDQFGSGGGFSAMFDQTNAQWQAAAVKHYVDNPPDDPHFPPAGSFPPTGRATPDVSALGEGYQVVANGKVTPVGGTSASAPAFAGMVSLLNEARAQKSKAPLGFLNPFLYAHADAFRDVTLGTNAIGRGTGPIKYGFNATAGWDPATGLGTPIFDKLLDAALNA